MTFLFLAVYEPGEEAGDRSCYAGNRGVDGIDLTGKNDGAIPKTYIYVDKALERIDIYWIEPITAGVLAQLSH